MLASHQLNKESRPPSITIQSKRPTIMREGLRMTLLVTILMLQSSMIHSFTLLPRRTSAPRTSLALVPDQGKQLVAASCTVYKEKQVDSDTESDVMIDTKETAPPTERARTFVSRVFSLPAALRHPYVAEMVFPLVGFRRCQSNDGETRWLPTQSNASCRLPPTISKEPVVGWYSPICRLSCTDDDMYCSAKRDDWPMMP